MAKNKKKAELPHPFSEREYIKTRARQLPLGKCYALGNWKQQKYSPVVVTRCHKQGTFTIGMFIVDMLCRGVTDSEYFFNITREELDDTLKTLSQPPALMMEEIPYEVAHNLIYGAVAFAGGVWRRWLRRRYQYRHARRRVRLGGLHTRVGILWDGEDTRKWTKTLHPTRDIIQRGLL